MTPTPSQNKDTGNNTLNPSQYTNTGHDTPPHHSIQTQGGPVIVLSIAVEHHTGSHNYLFQCLGSDPTEKFLPRNSYRR